MAKVQLRDIRKTYLDTEVIHGVSIDIADGEFIVIVGPSGCGKSTLLRMVAGLEAITSGEIVIGDRVVNTLEPKDRDIAMVFQNYALYPHMSVYDNMAYGLKIRGLKKSDIDAMVKRAAGILELAPLLERKPRQLSGGQRQRVAMGRAIVREPAVFLFDEPLSNLDAQLRVQMRAEVSRIQKRLAVATVYVTHDQIEAMTMGSRVAVMRNGSVQQCDAPQALYDRPANLFVAAFIGSPSMNLYEAAVGEQARSLRLGGQEIILSDQVALARPALASYSGRKVVIGLRPEHLPAPGPADRSVIEGDVDLVGALGNEQLVHFAIDALRITTEFVSEEKEQLMTRGAGVARVDTRTPMKPGERGRFAVDIERMQFFDAESGQAIWN